MQIVIDIPKTHYDRIVKEGNGYFEGLIKNGIPLPKHHGLLIDADDIGLTDFEIISCDGDYKQALKLICKKIDNAPTIIEADNTESEDKVW